MPKSETNLKLIRECPPHDTLLLGLSILFRNSNFELRISKAELRATRKKGDK